MKSKLFFSLSLAALVSIATPARAQIEIQWWHAMPTALGEWVNDLAKDFNASQTQYKVVTTFKGSYDESMTAAIAAFRSGNAPHILQVFEVGTASMRISTRRASSASNAIRTTARTASVIKPRPSQPVLRQ